VFFDEKGISPLVEKLAVLANDEGKENISREEIIDLIQKMSGVDNIELEQETLEITEEVNMSNTDVSNKITELIDSEFSGDDLNTDDFVFPEIDDPIHKINEFVGNDDFVMPESIANTVETETVSTVQEVSSDPITEEIVDSNTTIQNNFEFNPDPSISDSIEDEINNLKTQFDHLVNFEMPEISMTEANSSFQKEIESLTGDLA
jgi:hypothetical protein